MAKYNIEVDEFAMRHYPLDAVVIVHNRDNGDTLEWNKVTRVLTKSATRRTVKPETALYAAVQELASRWLKENA